MCVMSSSQLVMTMRFPKNHFWGLALATLLDLRVETVEWE